MQTYFKEGWVMEAGEGQILGNFQEGVVLKYAQHGSALAPSPPS